MKTREGVSIIEVLFAMGIASIGLLGTVAAIAVAGRQASCGLQADAEARIVRNAEAEFRIRRLNVPAETWWSQKAVASGRWYCLDPLYATSGGLAGIRGCLPAVAGAGPRMTRVTVRGPSGALGADAMDVLFRRRDGLVHDLPSDRTLPPVAKFTSGARDTDGLSSWFVTVEVPPARGETLLWCRIHYVVCWRRDTAAEDRLCDVLEIDEDSIKIAPRAGRPPTDTDVLERQWVLLLGIDWKGQEQFGWYQVTHTSGDPVTHLSVFGRTWMCAPERTQVAIVDGVVFVAERTIQMEVNVP